jgi:hypothetical protein
MNTQTNTYKIANTLLTRLADMEHVTIRDLCDDSQKEYEITVDLGRGWAGDYRGGLWGDPSITDDQLTFTTSVTDWHLFDDDEFNYTFNEGIVSLNYRDFDTNDALAYTSELEHKIVAVIEQRTGGLLIASGSEQGMQGMDSADDCYLSLDVSTHRDLDETADRMTDSQRDAIRQRTAWAHEA